ncbi:MAG: histidine phosphatase family protein [Herpetosiphonaceae bacterium]|nr:histidine phosphatase family protein [Herpetosiphonaceae bacterium]
MHLILVRHGETAWNAERRYQGHHPVPLNERGRQQAARAGARLKNIDAVGLYASDIVRAWETAEIIGLATGLAPQPLPDLREIDDGQWAGLTPDELLARFPEHMATMRQAPDITMRIGGESYAQLQLRTVRAFEQLVDQHRGQTVIGVSHGGAIRALVCHLLGAPLAHFGRLWIDNGGLVEIVAHSDGWRVLRLNDTAHLDGALALGE